MGSCHSRVEGKTLLLCSAAHIAGDTRPRTWLNTWLAHVKLLVHLHSQVLLRADISPFSTWPIFVLGKALTPYASALHHKASVRHMESMMFVFRSQRFHPSCVTMCRSQEITVCQTSLSSQILNPRKSIISSSVQLLIPQRKFLVESSDK